MKVGATSAATNARLDRIGPHTAYHELVTGDALLVDIRPAALREAEGEIDPHSDARLPDAAYDARVVVPCQDGYTSSLAADALQRVGIRRDRRGRRVHGMAGGRLPVSRLPAPA